MPPATVGHANNTSTTRMATGKAIQPCQGTVQLDPNSDHKSMTVYLYGLLDGGCTTWHLVVPPGTTHKVSKLAVAQAMSNPSKSFLHSDDQQAGQVQKVKKVIQVQSSILAYDESNKYMVISTTVPVGRGGGGGAGVMMWHAWRHVMVVLGVLRPVLVGVGQGCGICLHGVAGGTTAGLVWGRWSDAGGGEVAAAAVSMQQTCGRQAKVALGEDTAMSCDS
ncbi:hypothetical protein EDB89DRAFT_1902626 [Lactarius sanguifluus]|nr:hypothetical protein EDB89DRAFT_1902626 [Lactarius sanguifluus]